MKKEKLRLLHITIIIGAYLAALIILKPHIFTQQFDKTLISRYFLSQDIPREVPGKRLFLSDSDVYVATGYLYANGHDPSEFNFEHPPLIKYLFGYSVLIFNNPLIVQVFLGIGLLVSVYVVGLRLFKNSQTSLLGSLFLLLDPLFLDISSQTLLDIGQTFLMLLYFYVFFYHKKSFVAQGVLLGLFAGTKFWITPAFFVIVFAGYKLIKKDLHLKDFVLHLFVALATYALLYSQTFVIKGGNFNLPWHMLKTLKYRLQHNTSTYFGASLILFVTGFLKPWWTNSGWIRTAPWSILWPIGLARGVFCIIKPIIKNKISLSVLIGVVPMLYLLFLGVQAPFPRYFLIILPFIYLVLADFLNENILRR